MLNLLSIEQEFNAKLAELDTAITEKKSVETFNSIENELKTIEEKYADEKRVRIFEAAAETENPVYSAVEVLEYGVLGHKIIRENGLTTGVEKSTKIKAIDFVQFFRYCKLDTRWYLLVERFNQLMTLRAAKDLGYSDEAILKVCNSFFMSQLAEKVSDFAKAEKSEKARKANPVSNKTILGELQMVLDAFLMMEGEDDKNTLKVTTKDVNYILMTYTKRGKRAGIVSMPKSQTMAALFADIVHQIVTNRGYTLDYKEKKKDEQNGEAVAEVSESTAEVGTEEPAAPEQVDEDTTGIRRVKKPVEVSEPEAAPAEAEKTEA